MSGFSHRFPVLKLGFCAFAVFCLLACKPRKTAHSAEITFEHVPQSALGGAGETDLLSGRVRNTAQGLRIVVYVRSRSSWYVQPLTIHPFTDVRSDGEWHTQTHLGTDYAAILVNRDYRPTNVMRDLPAVGNSVLAVKAVAGDASSSKPDRHLQFSSYDWTVRHLGSDRNGTPHAYSASNAFVDGEGFLHLRLTKDGADWACSEVALTRSLGYGRYSLRLQGVEKLEPATVFSMFTWDNAGTDQDRREVDTELTRWGDPNAKNGEYVIQPFFRPTNTYRYSVDGAQVSLAMVWQSGSVSFSTARVGEGNKESKVAAHTFTADIPSPQSESVHLNLCTFDYAKVKQTANGELVLTSFRYLP